MGLEQHFQMNRSLLIVIYLLAQVFCFCTLRSHYFYGSKPLTLLHLDISFSHLVAFSRSVSVKFKRLSYIL